MASLSLLVNGNVDLGNVIGRGHVAPFGLSGLGDFLPDHIKILQVVARLHQVADSSLGTAGLVVQFLALMTALRLMALASLAASMRSSYSSPLLCLSRRAESAAALRASRALDTSGSMGLLLADL